MTSALACAEIARGIAAREAGNATAAGKAFESVITLDPNEPLGHLYLADLHVRQGRAALGLSTAATGLALPCTVSDRSFGLQVVALAYINDKQPEKAVQAAADALANDPENDANVFVHAQALWAAKDYKQAEAQFQHAIRLAPASVQALTTYARFLLSFARLAEARAIVTQAVTLQPDDTTVMLLRGRIAFRYDALPEARDMALWVLSRQAMNREALHLLAQVQGRRNWLTAPFWLGFNAMVRNPRLGRALLLLFFLALLGMCIASLPFMPNGNSDAPWRIAFWCFTAYVLLSSATASWQVKKELRQVKLRRSY